jgi:hypothetical protein
MKKYTKGRQSASYAYKNIQKDRPKRCDRQALQSTDRVCAHGARRDSSADLPMSIELGVKQRVHGGTL